MAETMTVDQGPITDMSETVPVEILLPPAWDGLPTYRLLTELHIQGEVIPRYTTSDGASTPRWLWWLFPPIDRYLTDAVLHDYLLKKGLPFRIANTKFFAALKKRRDRGGLSAWRYYLIHVFVGAYGWWQDRFNPVEE